MYIYIYAGAAEHREHPSTKGLLHELALLNREPRVVEADAVRHRCLQRRVTFVSTNQLSLLSCIYVNVYMYMCVYSCLQRRVHARLTPRQLLQQRRPLLCSCWREIV